jgi:hypothetical protein
VARDSVARDDQSRSGHRPHILWGGLSQHLDLRFFLFFFFLAMAVEVSRAVEAIESAAYL